jgi:putative transposase
VITAAREQLPDLPLERMCQLMGVPRSLLYRIPADRSQSEAQEAELIAAIEGITLAFPGYGYRRVRAQLARDGKLVNHKRVLRLMREQGLLCRLKRRWVATTDSEHGLRTYPNLLKSTKASDLTGLDRVWVADITYVRLEQGFCYVAAVLDALSRRVVGWHISRDIDAALVLRALEKALEARRPGTGFLHHSDRGVQYACRGYVERLEAAGAQISMSRKGCPRDNAKAESFFRTLKVEEVYLQEYASLAQASACIGQFIEAVYNQKRLHQKRLHSSLGYLPPAEFEEKLKADVEKANSSSAQDQTR